MAASLKYRVRVYGFDPASGQTAEGPRVGFWTTRYLEANDEAQAGDLAVRMVLSEERLAEVVKAEWRGQPVIRAEEVAEIESFDGIPTPGAGYTFFEEADEPQ
jgi:hypothetical protein